MTKSTKKSRAVVLLGMLLAGLLFLVACTGAAGSVGPVGPAGPPGSPGSDGSNGQDLIPPDDGDIQIYRAGTWFETAYAEWQASNQQAFEVEIRRNGGGNVSGTPNAGEWVSVDSELVRVVDYATKTWRVDVPGLRNDGTDSKPITYTIKIKASTREWETDSLTPQAFDRQGYAFSPNSVNGLTHTSGGYLPNGAVRPDAEIVYLTQQSMDSILTAERFNANLDTSVNTQRPGSDKSRRPLIIRVIGQIGKIDYIGDIRYLPKVAQGNKMMRMDGARQVTLEGIGNDATIDGWGITLSKTQDIVVSNLTFRNNYDDALYIDGGSGNTNNFAAFSHHWVHNNTFFPGQNRYSVGQGEPDHVKGDGSLDVANGASHFTISYNVFSETGKSSLISGGATALVDHGTIHHNLYHKTSERTPRVRNGFIHVFNNIYEGVGGEPGGGAGYGIGAGHRANIISEGNSFVHTYRPYIISGEKSSNAAGANIDGNSNTLSNDAPGVIITSLYENHQDVIGRQLQADSLDDWSKGVGQAEENSWYFEEELTLPNGHTITNTGRNNGNKMTHTFVPFDADLDNGGVPNGFNSGADFDQDDQLKEGVTTYTKPAITLTAEQQEMFGPFADWTPRANTGDTLSELGVQTAQEAAKRVRQFAGTMV